MKFFSSYTAFQDWLASRNVFHSELGLSRMEKALKKLELQFRPLIQVLGTNGKGSTSNFLASLAQTHGLKAGLYTSPHLVSMEERIKINGISPGPEALLECANAVYGAAPDLTWFEFVTLMALLVFLDQKVDLVIMEAGLGGANDATSALPAAAHCFTPIAMDHADIIGPTLTDIANDKAQAIQRNTLVFSAPQFPVARDIIEASVQEKESSLVWCEPVCLPVTALLQGPHQETNAGLALGAWRGVAPGLGVNPALEAEIQGLTRATIPGRLQHVPPSARYPELWIDGAHNPHGIRALCKALGRLSLSSKTIIYSALNDKDWRTCSAILAHEFPDSEFFIVQLENPRAEAATAISSFITTFTTGHARCFYPPNALKHALESCGKGPVLLTGSLYLCGEFFSLFPELLQGTQNENRRWQT